jgi:fructose-bisphosphate aldolase, class II
MPLVNTIEMFKKAYDGHYAIGAFNINNMEQIQGIVDACNELHSPVILQVSRGARKYAKPIYLKKMVEAACIDSNIPIALHLDHGDTFETCKDCIDQGFSSVMIDGSSLSYEENVALTKKVCEYAHDINAHPTNPNYITVEGELGVLAGVEEDVVAENHSYTDPSLVEDFVKRTGVDSLAIAIGTSHGAYKFKPGTKPQLRFDILEEVSKRLPGFPIVLHGASSVMPEYVALVNQYGGSMPDAIGVPEDLLAKASKMAVCKINIDSDVRLACTAMVRKHLAEHPDHFDPRQYLTDARQAVHDIVKHKVQNVLGSENKA